MPQTRSQSGAQREEASPVEERSPVVVTQQDVSTAALSAPVETSSTKKTLRVMEDSSGTEETTSYETVATSYEEGTLMESEKTEKTEKTKKTVEKTVSKSKKGRRTSSIMTVRQLELEQEDLELELKIARLQKKLLKIKQRKAAIEEDSDLEVDDEEREEDVQKWVQSTVDEVSKKGQNVEASKEGRLLNGSGKGQPQIEYGKPAVNPAAETLGKERLQEDSIKTEVPRTHRPVDAIRAAPTYVQELPTFDGDYREWLSFQGAYDRTARLFDEVHNIARIRHALKGAALESVRCLLYSDCTPEDVMETLRNEYGRPDNLILAELDKIRSLPRFGTSAQDICEFSKQVGNTVATIRTLKRPNYLISPDLMRAIISKMPEIIRFRWLDYVGKKVEPELSDMAEFLKEEAIRHRPLASKDMLPVQRQALPPPRPR